jgi:hypothetical protein
MDKPKNDEMPIRVYKPSGWAQLVTWLIVTMMLGFFALLIQAGDKVTWLMVFFIPFYGFILWALFLSNTQRYLAIYEDGLEYRFGGTVSFSRWEDLRRFESRASGKSSVLGIYTSHLEKRHDGNGFERFLLGGYDDFIPLNLVLVPTRWDGCWTGAVVDTAKMAETEFGRELLHYAPQLLEERKEKQKHG